MEIKAKSIRTFIGAKDYDVSRRFYADLGFKEYKTSETMSYFGLGGFGFYLQDAYVKDWVDNSMIFLEVEDPALELEKIKQLNLDKKYAGVRIKEMHYNDWGNEFFLYDPSCVLWHIGSFKN